MARNGQTASVTLDLEQGMMLEYKYTRGTWSTVEKSDICLEHSNRALVVQDQGSGQLTVSDTVGGWADLCP